MKPIYRHLLLYTFVCSLRGHNFRYFTAHAGKVCLRCTALYDNRATH